LRRSKGTLDPRLRGDDDAKVGVDVPRIPVKAISLALALAVLAYVAAVTAADWDGVRRAALAVQPLVLLQVVGLSLASYLFRFARWQRLMKALQHRIPVMAHLQIYLAGLALTVSPGKLGEMVRSIYLRPHGVPYPHSIAAFVCERTCDLLAVSALGSLALLLFPSQGLAVAAPVCIAALLVLAVRTRLASWLASRVASRIGRVPSGAGGAETLATLRTLYAVPRVLPALALTLPAWTAQGVALYLIVDSLGYAVSPQILVGIYSLSLLTGAATFIPGGLGATEAAIVLMLTTAGLTLPDAVYASLVARALPLWLAVAVGVVSMLGASRRSPS
jgi:uncharacterized protein (TIRG00374 family)